MRLHEHSDMRTDFIGCQSAIATYLRIRVDEGDDGEAE
jgi:hypothetical protein